MLELEAEAEAVVHLVAHLLGASEGEAIHIRALLLLMVLMQIDV
jgi:hypothetical protein